MMEDYLKMYAPDGGVKTETTPAVASDDTPRTEAQEKAAHDQAAMYPDADAEAQTEAQGNPYALTPDSDAERLYGGSARVEIGEDVRLDAFIGAGDDAAVLRTNLGHIASEIGASSEDVNEMVHAARPYASPVSDERMAEMKQDTLSELRAQYGDRLDAKLQSARVMLQSFPDLNAWLQSSGAGNDVQIVGKLVKLASSPRGSARIRAFEKYATGVGGS